MPNYLCMQRSLPAPATAGSAGADGAAASQKPSPAQMQDMYARFMAWQEQFKDNLIDMGGRLGTGKLVTADTASDGPFVEVKELIGGYMIVAADDLDAAADVARQCPGLVGPTSGVEVIEILTK